MPSPAIPRLPVCLALLAAAMAAPFAQAATPAALERQFRNSIQPFLRTYCSQCHGPEKPKGELDLSAYDRLDEVAKDHRRWELVLEQLQAGTMPPEKASKHPTPELRREVMDWIRAVRQLEASRSDSDPGPMLARRLSNAEYDYTIRDLTGHDLRPTREFPVDPANEAGFDNSAESLAMSPALLKKYLDAARYVADHLVLKPQGLDFAPHPVITDTDRDKYVVRRVIEFYQRQPTDYADYFRAAWRYRHRAALAKPQATLAEIAAEQHVSPKYLATIWNVLTVARDDAGPITALQAMWRDLPKPDESTSLDEGCRKMRDFVIDIRQQLVPEVKNLKASPIHDGSQCLVLWKNRQMAANRMRYSGGAKSVKGLAAPTDPTAAAAYEASFKRFCEVFPDAFYVSERARVYLDPEKEKKLAGRLLSAGFHSMTGYFRDDGPLYELILDADDQRELDRLWQEFDFINSAPMRQYTSFLWFDRTDSRYLRDEEFDRFRAEDKDVTSEAKIRELAEVYLAKAVRNDASETAQQAIRDYFKNISASIRWVEQARVAAEPSQVAALGDFAERAYRRPLSQAERDELAAFYRSLREQEGLSHEDAIRDTIVSVLVSPHFCYRLTLPGDYALASRLSYFLWSSMPDAELLKHAAAGDLHRPEVLVAQTRRMLQDDRIRGLATEFGGNWLDFRRFEEHNAVDRGRFASFTDELRQAMFEEPIRFLLDVMQHNRQVLEFLYGEHTFVNHVLAEHYGMPWPDASAEQWVRVGDARQYGRGGLLPMAVFLTKNAPGLRTSPVKRGYWVVRRVLGETIPAPPAEVPELPNDESKLGERTLREVLAAHREHKACAACHERFDSLGLVFEGYGPIGERREADLGGRAVETGATFPGGSEGAGLEGLLTYIRQQRQQEFVDNLCRKLLAYALGRSLHPSDDALLAEMRTKLATDGHRFSTLVETIVTSPQFMNKRGGD